MRLPMHVQTAAKTISFIIASALALQPLPPCPVDRRLLGFQAPRAKVVPRLSPVNVADVAEH